MTVDCSMGLKQFRIKVSIDWLIWVIKSCTPVVKTLAERRERIKSHPNEPTRNLEMEQMLRAKDNMIPGCRH